MQPRLHDALLVFGQTLGRVRRLPARPLAYDGSDHTHVSHHHRLLHQLCRGPTVVRVDAGWPEDQAERRRAVAASQARHARHARPVELVTGEVVAYVLRERPCDVPRGAPRRRVAQHLPVHARVGREQLVHLQRHDDVLRDGPPQLRDRRLLEHKIALAIALRHHPPDAPRGMEAVVRDRLLTQLAQFRLLRLQVRQRRLWRVLAQPLPHGCDGVGAVEDEQSAMDRRLRPRGRIARVARRLPSGLRLHDPQAAGRRVDEALRPRGGGHEPGEVIRLVDVARALNHESETRIHLTAGCRAAAWESPTLMRDETRVACWPGGVGVGEEPRVPWSSWCPCVADDGGRWRLVWVHRRHLAPPPRRPHWPAR